jgi:hypothetical protein
LDYRPRGLRNTLAVEHYKHVVPIAFDPTLSHSLTLLRLVDNLHRREQLALDLVQHASGDIRAGLNGEVAIFRRQRCRGLLPRSEA